MSRSLKTVFKTKVTELVDGNEVEQEITLAIIPPTSLIKQKAKLVHGRAYAEAVDHNLWIREELDQRLRKKNLWNDEKQTKTDEIRKFLLDGELKLARHDGTIEEARELALQMSDKRMELNELYATRNVIDRETADAYADDTQFNFLVANCTVYNDGDRSGKPFFTYDGEHASTEAYIDRATEQVAVDAASKLSEVMYGSANDILGRLPENQFLRDYGFADDEFHLIDEQGRRIDRKGRLVDKDGRFINEGGEYVDADGNRVDKEGKYVVENKPFVNKHGEIVLPKTANRTRPTQDEAA